MCLHCFSTHTLSVQKRIREKKLDINLTINMACDSTSQSKMLGFVFQRAESPSHPLGHQVRRIVGISNSSNQGAVVTVDRGIPVDS